MTNVIQNVMLIVSRINDTINTTQTSSDLGGAIIMELFVSIHMSVFVLSPIAKIINKNRQTEIFFTLFLLRIIILLICNTTFGFMTAVVDFFSVFVGGFIVVPFLGLIKYTFTSGETQYHEYNEINELDLLNAGIKEPDIVKNQLIDVYTQIENAISVNDEKRILELCDEKQANKLISSINFNNEHNLKNVIENLEVKGAKIISASQNYVENKITLIAKVSKKDYLINSKGEISKKSKTYTQNYLYELGFTKPISKKKTQNKKENKCKNCGAPVSSSQEKCSYCGTHFIKKEKSKNWVLSSKKILNNK